MKFSYKDEVKVKNGFYKNKIYCVAKTINFLWCIRLYYLSSYDNPNLWVRESKLVFFDAAKEKDYQDNVFNKNFQKNILEV